MIGVVQAVLPLCIGPGFKQTGDRDEDLQYLFDVMEGDKREDEAVREFWYWIMDREAEAREDEENEGYLNYLSELHQQELLEQEQGELFELEQYQQQMYEQELNKFNTP